MTAIWGWWMELLIDCFAKRPNNDYPNRPNPSTTQQRQRPDTRRQHPVGGGAPIAGGIGILLALRAAYGGKKVYDDKKRKLAE